MDITVNVRWLIVAGVIIFIFIGIILGIYFSPNLINFINGREENNENIKKSRPCIITKKDMSYWIIMLTALFVWAFSGHIYKDKFTEYIAFAGTVTSIILGVVAIIYSFFQSYDNALNQDSISKTFDKLNETSKDLEKNISSLSDFDEKIKKMEDKLKDIPNLLNKIDKLQLTLDEQSKTMNAMNDTMRKMNQSEMKKSEEDWDDDLELDLDFDLDFDLNEGEYEDKD